METYQMVIAFSNHGSVQVFYVVNMTSKRIQSSWSNELEARRVVRSLNYYEKLTNKKESM